MSKEQSFKTREENNSLVATRTASAKAKAFLIAGAVVAFLVWLSIRYWSELQTFQKRFYLLIGIVSVLWAAEYATRRYVFRPGALEVRHLGYRRNRRLPERLVFRWAVGAFFVEDAETGKRVAKLPTSLIPCLDRITGFYNRVGATASKPPKESRKKKKKRRS